MMISESLSELIHSVHRICTSISQGCAPTQLDVFDRIEEYSSPATQISPTRALQSATRLQANVAHFAANVTGEEVPVTASFRLENFAVLSMRIIGWTVEIDSCKQRISDVSKSRLLSELNELGIELDIDGGEIICRADPEILSDSIRDKIRLNKDVLLKMLREKSNLNPGQNSEVNAPEPGHAPLSFS